MPYLIMPRILLAAAWLMLALPLLGCVTLPWMFRNGASTQHIPRWACPTPTPLPYGETGPIKAQREETSTDPVSGQPAVTVVPEYYAIWEQEYGALGSPAPAPTPYIKIGGGFSLGQLVNLTPELDAQASVQRTGVLSGTQRLYEAKLRWVNHGGAIALASGRQVQISALRRPDGTRIGGNGWAWSQAAAQLAGRAADARVLEAPIAPGTTETIVPILAPDGEVQTLDLRLDLAGGAESVRVQWARAHEPLCGLGGTEGAVYAAAAPLAEAPLPPAGASALIRWAYSQIGRPYCWGGKGQHDCVGNPEIHYADACPARQGLPCWDCSGLTWAAYKSIGLTIGHGTANQRLLPAAWQAGDRADPAAQARPGDLLLFAGGSARGRASGPITHVGLYAGDGVMVHASRYPDGVIATPNIFHNPYYGPRLALVVRPSVE